MKEFIGDDSITDNIWEMMFNEADLNKDGYIDIDEFKIVVKNIPAFSNE